MFTLRHALSVADVDECEANNGGCEQTCTDNEGGYECTCGTGWSLNKNKHSCDGEEEERGEGRGEEVFGRGR